MHLISGSGFFYGHLIISVDQLSGLVDICLCWIKYDRKLSLLLFSVCLSTFLYFELEESIPIGKTRTLCI